MNIALLARAIFDRRNVTIGADVAGHVRDIIADGRIEAVEVIDATHDVVDDALHEYGKHDHVLVTVPASSQDVAARAASATNDIYIELVDKLADRQMTASEVNDLVAFAAKRVLEVINVDGQAKPAGEVPA